MRKTLLLLILLLSIYSSAQTNSNTNSNINFHPSLLIQSGDEPWMKQSVKNSPELTIIQNVIFKESDNILKLPCLKYVKIGRRLLYVSRECLKRVFYLSYSYRITGDEKYAKRAEDELLAVCAFSDWNPSHFLDVAEMTMGVAIGYDWTYSYLSPSSRKIIGDAIINHGIKPSMDSRNNGWLNGDNNWNQVCNAGMLFGAIAIRDVEPELAKTIIDRSLEAVKRPMSQYEPDGTFQEGFMYWGYGTSFNVMLISAAEKLFGKELFPVSQIPGFIRSGTYILNMVGPTGNSFNYSDCGNPAESNPSIFWFAKKAKDLSLLWTERKYLNSQNEDLRNDRLLPASIIWGSGLDFNAAKEPTSDFWIGQGITPVCLMRTSWTDKNALFLGFKAGTPAAGHGHMDVGSFVMEANGVRWASDYGMQDYNSLESKGIDIWNGKQNGQRWSVFRYNNLTHNTLSFNDSLQRVTGTCKIDTWSDKKDKMFASSDITPVYEGQVKKVIRTASLINSSYVSIKDEIETLPVSTRVRWTLLTEAVPTLNQKAHSIELTKNGKRLLIKVNSPAQIMLKTWSTKSIHDYDALNPDTYLVGFEVQLPANAKSMLDVSLIPQDK